MSSTTPLPTIDEHLMKVNFGLWQSRQPVHRVEMRTPEETCAHSDAPSLPSPLPCFVCKRWRRRGFLRGP